MLLVQVIRLRIEAEATRSPNTPQAVGRPAPTPTPAEPEASGRNGIRVHFRFLREFFRIWGQVCRVWGYWGSRLVCEAGSDLRLAVRETLVCTPTP